MSLNQEKARFRKYLERIIFQKEELTAIRNLISEIKEDNTTHEKLKTKLLQSRARILKDIADFVDFYMKQKNERHEKTLQANQVKVLQEDIAQKNSLLQEIAEKLLDF